MESHLQEHNANTGHSQRTPGRNFVDDAAKVCQGRWQSRLSDRSADHSLIINNSLAVMRAALPCYRRDNSLLFRIEFPVIFLGNLAHKCWNTAGYSRCRAAKSVSKMIFFLLIP